MIKRRWDGDPTCHFCPCPETVDHLFFQCPTAKVVWGIIGTCLGADNTPRDMNQYKNWLNFWLPNGASVHVLGFAAICWAIWKSRNRACFDNKIIRNPAQIVIHACALMVFWAGLYTPELQDQLAVGVKFILSCASCFGLADTSGTTATPSTPGGRNTASRPAASTSTE